VSNGVGKIHLESSVIGFDERGYSSTLPKKSCPYCSAAREVIKSSLNVLLL